MGQLSVTPPDDEPGFSIILDFDSDLTSFGFLWVDLDDETGEAAEIIFTDTMGTAGTGDDVNVTVGFEEFLDSGAFPQNLAAGSVGWDDGSADEIERITPAELSAYAGFTISSFDRIRFNCTTSGGLGTLFYDDPNILAVDLVNFTATDDNEDELGWETSSEIDSAAFHVCRAEPSRHRSAKVGQRITANPIPAVGENGGASYSFTDPLLLKDRAEVRGYFLEEIELDGTSNFYGPVWFNGSSVTAVGDWAKY